MEISAEVVNYRVSMTPANQVIFDRLAEIAYTVEPGLQNAIKWRAPTFTANGNWHHWLFSIAQTKKGVTLNFHKGWLLADPTHSLQGEGKHLRQMVFVDIAEIQDEVVAGLMREAIRHQIEME